MDLGRVYLRYRTPGGRLERLSGYPPLGDGRVRLEAFAAGQGRVLGTGHDRFGHENGRPGPAPVSGPTGEVGLRLVKSEPGVRLVSLAVHLEGFDLGDRFLANGFQSWSHTELLGPSDRLLGLRLLSFLRPYGDYGWVPYPGQPGLFRSHWLTYTTSGRAGGRPDRVSFVGSLNDTNAYTVFWVDYQAGRLWAEFDVEDWEPAPGDVLAHLFWAEGEAEPAARAEASSLAPAGAPSPAGVPESPLLPVVRAFARRLAEAGEPGARSDPYGFGPGRLTPRLDRRPGGWNSWYNYYTKVSQADMLAELAALRGLDLDYFQVDDGWQATTGEWLTLSAGFSDMKALASAVRDAGFEPGIWAAPLVTTKWAEVFRRGWVKPWKAGWNPGWRSSIYALDLDRPEARDYVRRVGDAFREWGFGLVKADFLYAAAVKPWGGRTRAQRMREAMRLVREAMPGRLLACGVPLASGVGLCDYARLGPDTALAWDDKLLAAFRYRERPSCVGALRTVLSRWFMNDSLYVLDPDVFLFGKGDLTDGERRTLYEVFTTLGGLQSFSDSLRALGPEETALIRRTFPLPGLEVRNVAPEAPGLFRVAVVKEGRPATLSVNLGDGPRDGLAEHACSWLG